MSGRKRYQRGAANKVTAWRPYSRNYSDKRIRPRRRGCAVAHKIAAQRVGQRVSDGELCTGAGVDDR